MHKLHILKYLAINFLKLRSNELVPYLADKFGIHSIGHSLTMRFVGVGESTIDKMMHDHLKLPENLMISSLFDKSRVDLTFSLPGDSPQDRMKLKQLENQLLQHLGEYMYSDSGETLEEVIIKHLKTRGESLVTAEVGSGGAIAAALNNVDDVSHTFYGGYIAPNHDVLFRMLGEAQTGAALDNEQEKILRGARIARQLIHSDWGIAVSNVLHDENSSYVYVGVCTPWQDSHAKIMTLRGRGEEAQQRLVTQALDYFRRLLK